MKKNRLYQSIAIALFYAPISVIADDSTTAESGELLPVIVTADYNAGVADVVTITSKAVDDSSIDSPRDLLRNVPGVELETQAVDGFAGFRIRGMGGAGSTSRTGQNRVAVNVDGVPLPDMFRTGHATRVGLAPFDTADLKVVDIIRGPETSISGKSGLAGTVKFVTKDPEDYYNKADGERFGGNVRTGYNGANSAFSIGATVAGQVNDNLSAMLSYSHHNAGEYPNYDKKKLYHDNGSFSASANPEKLADRIDSADIQQNNVMSKVIFAANANHQFSLKAEHSKRDFTADIIPAIGKPEKDYKDKNTGKRYAFSLRHDFVLDSSFADEGYWQAHYQKYDNHRDDDLAYGVSFGTTDYKVKGYGLEASLSKSIEAGSIEHTFNYGFNLQSQDYKARWSWDAPQNFGGPSNTTYQPDSETRQITAYVNDDIALADDRLHIMPGVEFTHYRIDAQPTPNYKGTLTDLNDSHFSWRLGATYELTDSQQLFGGYRQGYKVPSFGELNSGSAHSRLSNPNLKPEQSAGFTLGLRSQGEIGSQAVSVFYDTYRDLAIDGTLPTGEATTVNMDGKVVIYGLEYRGELDLHNAFGLPEGVKLQGALAYSKGKNKDTDQPYSDVDPLSGSVGLAYDAPSQLWGTALTLNFAAAKKTKDIADSDTTLIPVGGYGVTDLTAYFKPTKGLQINTGVYNVFDKKYAKWSEAQYESIFSQNYEQITEPGRFFGATLKYDF